MKIKNYMKLSQTQGELEGIVLALQYPDIDMKKLRKTIIGIAKNIELIRKSESCGKFVL